MTTVKDRVALVTGAGSGIGKEIALLFSNNGARVAVADIDMDGAKETVEEICSSDGDAIAIEMDVTDEDDVNKGVSDVVKTYGALHVLISNAGVQHIKKIVDLSFEDWRKVLNIHLDGAFLTTRAAMRQMQKQSDGAIIYMGSVHSKAASPLKAPYVSAKHALLGLCRTVAIEGADFGVRANVICPGFVKTPLVEKQIPEQAKDLGISEEEVVSDVMLKDTVDTEFTTTDDIAQAALFLAAFKTNALTGQSIIASHGWHME